mmetsp:Transcript_29808/g.81788  ORF Transcript_29808/g.81788 Transcript_29808/m.81788 type:complete len:517 (+) Transcript_29808:96-1646(+)
MFGGSGGGSSGSVLPDDLPDIDEFKRLVDQQSKNIYGMLSASVPKVDLKLPKLPLNAFGGTSSASDAKGDYSSTAVAPDDAGADASAQIKTTGAAANSAANKKAKEAQAKAEAARREAEETATKMQEELAQKAEEAKQHAMAQVVTPIAAAAASIAAAIGVSFLQLGALLGPMLAGAMAVFLNCSSLIKTHKERTDMIFDVLSSVFAKAKVKVVKLLDTVDDMISGPLDKLEGTIDDMLEEQKPWLEKVTTLEDAMKKVNVELDLPDVEDLRKPLDGCAALIEEFVGKAKTEVPAKLEELAASTFAGKVALDKSLFQRYFLILPMAMVVLVNIILMVVQVYVQYLVAPPAQQGSGDEHVQRRLRGHMGGDDHHSQGDHDGGHADKSPGSPFSVQSLMPYLQPTIVQIVLTLLQMLLVLFLSQGPRLCAQVNGAIESLQTKVNGRINDRIQGAVDKVFGVAFNEVKGKADNFFPKMNKTLNDLKDAIDKVKEMEEMAGKAQAAAGAAAGIMNGFGVG